MSPTQKYLELRMKVTADTSEAQRHLQQLAATAQQAQGGPAGGRPVGYGYSPPPGFGGPPSGAPPQPLTPATPNLAARVGVSSVPAFDRPIPVVIVGPRPLLVSGGAGGGAGAGTGGGTGGDKAADKAADLLTSLRNLQLGGGVGRFEQIKGFGDAAKGLGIPGGGMIGRLAGPAAIALTALKTAGEAGEILHDDYSTMGEKGRAAFRQFVPFGDTIQSGVDGISGRKAAFERADVDYQKRVADVNARTEIASYNLGYKPEQAGYEARAGLLARAKPILEGPSDRTTAAGEQKFREMQRMLPLQREEAKLQREASVATAQRVTAEQQLREIQAKRAAATALVKKKGEDLTSWDNWDGDNRHRVLLEQKAAADARDSFGGLERQAHETVAQRRRAEAEAKFGAGRAGVQKLGAEAEVLEEKAGRGAAAAQRLGGMQDYQRENGLQSLRNLQKFGVARASPQELAEAQAFAPLTVAKILQEHGKKTSQFAGGRESAPEDFPDVDELQKQAADKRNEVASKELDLESQLGKSAAEAGRDVGKYIEGIIMKLAEGLKAGIDRDKLLGRGASS